MGARLTLTRLSRLAQWRLLVVCVSIALAAVSCTGTDAVDQTAAGDLRFVAGNDTAHAIPPDQRKPAPAISGETLTGGQVSLDQFKGKVVLVNFWGSWCPPCRVEAPDLEAYYTANAADGLAVLGVTVKDTKTLALAFVKNKGLTYPSIFDPDGRIALTFRHLPPSSIPATIVIDRDGRVAGAYLGAMDDVALAKLVSPLLAET